MCDWSRGIAARDLRKHRERTAANCPATRVADLYAGPARVSFQAAIRESTGNRRLKDLLNALNRLDSLGYARSNGQRTFHKAFIGACLQKIYGEDIYPELPRLLREFDLDRLRRDVIVQSPRRFGKTVGVALFVAGCLWTLPNIEISIFSTGQRASMKLLALIYVMVTKLAGSTNAILAYNKQETLQVRCATGEKTLCSAYPCTIGIDK